MNGPLDPVFYGFVCTTALWLALLSTVSRFKVTSPSMVVKLAFGVATVLLLFLPTTGLPLWKWLFSFCPNPSLPLLGLVCVALWQHLSGVNVFSAADWRAVWFFGAAAGSALYLHPFGFETADLYYWGWHQRLAVWVIAGLAVALLCWGNRLGVLFLVALVAYELQALESHNGWDYIVDPFYWSISSCIVITRGAGAWLERRRLAAER